jgi:tyrosine-protein phosphatase YwqE
LEFFETLINEGCLLQGNITSLCGKYGTNTKHNLVLLVKKHMIHFMGTDTHRNVFPLNKCYVALSSITTRDMYKQITSDNFLKVINNEEIEPFNIIKSTGLFGTEKLK